MSAQSNLELASDPLAVELLGLAPVGRKLTVSDLLGTTARALAARPFFYILVAILAYSPGALIELVLSLEGVESPGYFGSWPARIVNVIFLSVGSGVMISAALEWMDGARLGPGMALKRGVQSAFSVFAVQWLLRLLLLGTIIPGGIVFAVGQGAGGIFGGLVSLAGACLMLLAAGYVYVRYCLALPRVVTGSSTASKSLSMSWRWTKGQDLPLMGAFIALLGALLIVSCLGAMPIMAWAMVSADAATGMGAESPGFQVLLAGMGLLIQAGSEVGLTLLAVVAYGRLVSAPKGVDVNAMVDVFS